ncbi:MAG: glycosyltransferase, partial [bacterium]
MKRILVMANRDFTLYNFRFELLNALLDAGHDVTIFLQEGPKVEPMVAAGCRFIPMDIDHRGTNPLHDLDTMLHFRRVMRAVKPDVALL